MSYAEKIKRGGKTEDWRRSEKNPFSPGGRRREWPSTYPFRAGRQMLNITSSGRHLIRREFLLKVPH